MCRRSLAGGGKSGPPSAPVSQRAGWRCAAELCTVAGHMNVSGRVRRGYGHSFNLKIIALTCFTSRRQKLSLYFLHVTSHVMGSNLVWFVSVLRNESCLYPLLYADCMFKSGSGCFDCLPSRNGLCSNHGPMISVDGAQDNGEHSRTLSPLFMPQSTALEVITEDQRRVTCGSNLIANFRGRSSRLREKCMGKTVFFGAKFQPGASSRILLLNVRTPAAFASLVRFRHGRCQRGASTGVNTSTGSEAGLPMLLVSPAFSASLLQYGRTTNAVPMEGHLEAQCVTNTHVKCAFITLSFKHEYIIWTPEDCPLTWSVLSVAQHGTSLSTFFLT